MGVDISVIWFAIIVFATLMYIIMDGFDLGLACCLTSWAMPKSAM